MNGVEAAASLFGSEESGSDLFATLGTETETTLPHPPADGLFLSDNSSSFIAQDRGTLDFSPQAEGVPSSDTTFPEYPTYSAEPQAAGTDADAVPYGQLQNGFAEQGHWGEHEQSLGSNYSTTTHRTATPPPPTTSYTSNYIPPTYPASSSTYSSYTPYQAPAPASHYTPESTVKGHTPQAYTPQTLSLTTATTLQFNGTPTLPPVPTPTASAITRPKISNAYDPPFLPTKPSRRTGRTAGAHQAYTSYQAPFSSSSYSSPPDLSSTYSGSYYQQSTSAHHEYGHYSAEAASSNYHPMTPAPTTSTATPYIRNAIGQAPHSHDIFPQQPANYPTGLEEIHPQANFRGQGESGKEFPQNGDNGLYVSANHTSGLHSAEYVDSYRPTRSASVGSACIPQEGPERMSPEPTVPKVTSPSMVPLPYSPTVQTVELQAYDAGSVSEHSSKPPPQNSLSMPSQAQRKDSVVHKDVYDPYAPKGNYTSSNYIPRTSSPLSVYNGRQNEPRKPSINAISGLNGTSNYGSVPRPLTGSTVPPHPSKPLSNALVDDPSARYTSQKSDTTLSPQEIMIKSTTVQYAPSPSLIGANDPLSRTSARAPIVTFGFGGKMVTCFHCMPGLNAGFDVALSSRTSSELKIHVLHKMVPESALNTPSASYPGPLLSDPGTPSLSLVRPGLSTQTKTKKAGVLTYLSGRADEIHQGLGYLGPAEKQATQNKLILIKLLKVMVENDGRLLGTPQSESAIRSTLVPRLEGSATLHDGASLQAAYRAAPLDEIPISITNLRSSTLDRIEDLLLQGDRRQAYQFAMDEKLWAHAMIIASSIDKEAWKDVVNDFLRIELGAKDDSRALALNSPHPMKNSRDSLRVAYSLFSGQGAAAVQELTPTNLLQRGTGRLQPPMGPAMTPRTPNFATVQPQPNIQPEFLAKWAETVAMIISSPLTPETSGALTALGDQLLANKWVEAAHACYLLSPQTSLIGGLGTPAARVILVGSNNPTDSIKDPDTLIFSEILEFALSLVPTGKGQEAFHGLPHLQAYRFIRAVSLAETGDIQLANRYCEAITASLTHNSPYTTVALLEQLQGLQQRLSGVFLGDKSASWIGGKLSKPSLDTIGGWLEGRFTQLVTGDSGSATSPTADQSKVSDQPFNGPFAHYSTISSTTPSARSSPQPPAASLNFPPPPQRTTSAMATSSPYSQIQIERSSSAMGYLRQKPTLQTSTTSASSISSSQSSPIGYGFNGYSRDQDPYVPKPQTPTIDELETPVQGASWWGSNGSNTTDQTPTAATFMHVDESSVQPSSDGFISLMDNQSFAFGSQHSRLQSSTSSQQELDEDDDLGLGNAKPKPEKKEQASPVKDNSAEAAPKAIPPVAPEKTTTPESGGGSWFGRWWKRNDSSTPGPVKASLGEESAFYYDKEQKRWVNRKVGAEESAKPAAPPPPPSRAQTASPGMSGSRPAPPPASGPPPRSASAIDLTTEPPTKVPMRIRSNLAPPGDSAPSTPTGTRLNPSGPPPPGRPKSQASKRPVRSRYVDVFQQETGGAL